jgi:hypothetical protein
MRLRPSHRTIHRILLSVALTIVSVFTLTAPAHADPHGHGNYLLYPRDTLLPSQYLKNGDYRLIMKTNGNLVLYENYGKRDQRVCGKSNTTAYPGAHAYLTPQGTFNVYPPHDGDPVWTTLPRTRGWNGATVGLSSQGFAHVYLDANNNFKFWKC